MMRWLTWPPGQEPAPYRADARLVRGARGKAFAFAPAAMTVLV
jgi:hypothetical protein